ncbi:MAG: RDD family protein [Bdellovibrionales bacterium]|nr:RDD family protein [Bdellovibrionales bacterium]
MEEISFKPLSEGLGFYDPPLQIGVSGPSKKIADLQKKNFLSSPEWPESLLSGSLDLDNLQNYEHLISLLEKPWLGKKSSGFFSGNRSMILENKEEENPASSPVTRTPGLSKNLIKKNTQEPSSVSPVKTTLDRSGQEFTNSELRSFLGKSLRKLQKTSQVSISASDKKDILNKNTLTEPSLNKNQLVPKKTFYFSLKAYLVDTFIISLLFFPPFALFVFLTQPVPMAVLPSVWPQILLTFLCFSQIYCLLCRLFCFETYGEALAKIRLCHLDSSKEVHPYRWLLRFFVSCATGFIFLPLLSLIFRKDFTARLTGLYFQKI